MLRATKESPLELAQAAILSSRNALSSLSYSSITLFDSPSVCLLTVTGARGALPVTRAAVIRAIGE